MVLFLFKAISSGSATPGQGQNDILKCVLYLSVFFFNMSCFDKLIVDVKKGGEMIDIYSQRAIC